MLNEPSLADLALRSAFETELLIEGRKDEAPTLLVLIKALQEPLSLPSGATFFESSGLGNASRAFLKVSPQSAKAQWSELVSDFSKYLAELRSIGPSTEVASLRRAQDFLLALHRSALALDPCPMSDMEKMSDANAFAV